MKTNDKRRCITFQSVNEDYCNSKTQCLLQEGPSRYGIESDPALVYYEKEVPAVFEGDLDVTDSGILSSSKCMKPEKSIVKNLNILCGSIVEIAFLTSPTKLKNTFFQ